MVRLIGFSAVVTLALGMLLTLGSNSAHADPACDVGSVAGVYGSDFDGFFNQERQNGNLQLFVQKPIRGVAIITLNDDAEKTAHVLIKGFVAATPQISQDGPGVFEFDGTWSVDGDCTGEIDLDEPGGMVDWIFVAVEGGTELFILSNGSLAKAHAKRL